MKVEVIQGSLVDYQCDMLVVNLFEGEKNPGGATGALNLALDNLIISELIEKDDFKGKESETALLRTYGKIPARYVLVVGLGKQEKFSLNVMRKISTKVIKEAQGIKAKTVGSILHGAGIAGLPVKDCSKVITEASLIASYKFDKYKSHDLKESDAPKYKNIDYFGLVEIDENKIQQAQEGCWIGNVIAECTNFARDLVNEPPSYMTPEKLAEIASTIEGVECEIYQPDQIEALRMHAFLAVGRGGQNEPRLIKLRYKPSGEARKKVAIVGKGVMFDSGGLSLKPAGAMETMKCDMSGAAATLGTLKACAKLNIDKEVIGIIAACENMPDGNAYKPGDIVGSRRGKTIEVLNTDAEGRLTLADALDYALDEKPQELIDIATLTGACVVALGEYATGIMGTNQDYLTTLISAANDAGEKFWQLPLFDEYTEEIKSSVADLKNTGSRWAGASTAGAFLKEFVNDTVLWAHLDIAGSAWLDKGNLSGKGATGTPIPTLVYYLLNHS